jgi:hypothetical protein
MHLVIWPRQSSKTSQTNFMTTCERLSVRKALFRRKMTVTPLQNVERRSRCKRNKWKGPTRSVGSRPFMPACFLTGAERSGNQTSRPRSSLPRARGCRSGQAAGLCRGYREPTRGESAPCRSATSRPRREAKAFMGRTSKHHWPCGQPRVYSIADEVRETPRGWNRSGVRRLDGEYSSARMTLYCEGWSDYENCSFVGRRSRFFSDFDAGGSPR